MIADEVSIYNVALNAIGARSNLSSTTENSRDAEVCRLWYPIIRDQILCAAPWPSCEASKRLALLSERDLSADWVSTDPSPGYKYKYSCPSDMLRPRYLADFSPFRISAHSGSVRALNTNRDEAVLTYTQRNYTVAGWESPLQMAVAYGLAANIAMPLTGKAQRANFLIQQANDLINTARLEAANQIFEPIETVPDWISARGYSNPTNVVYSYPVGSLLAIVTT